MGSLVLHRSGYCGAKHALHWFFFDVLRMEHQHININITLVVRFYTNRWQKMHLRLMDQTKYGRWKPLSNGMPVVFCKKINQSC
jgi:hypothetical protein